MERGAAVGLALGPDTAAVAENDPGRECEPDARAFVVLGPVQPLENLEEPVGVPRIEARSVVLHEVRAVGPADLDSSVSA